MARTLKLSKNYKKINDFWPPEALSGVLLGPSWTFLGASWALLGQSWAVLGCLGAILGRLETLLESKEAQEAEIVDVP